MILLDISNILDMKDWGLAIIYLATSFVLPIFYIKQIKKYLNGDKGVGDLCFNTEIIQAILRVPALMYSVSIGSGPVFISVLLDLIGRIAKISVAKKVHKNFINKNNNVN